MRSTVLCPTFVSGMLMVDLLLFQLVKLLELGRLQDLGVYLDNHFSNHEGVFVGHVSHCQHCHTSQKGHAKCTELIYVL